MATNRISRETTNRANTSRRKPWQPPAKLDAPPAPDGFEHRWIRTQLRGEDDKANVFSRMREGWEQVKAEEYGDVAAKYPVIEEGKNKGIIGVGGLMLARIPTETVQERTEYFRDQTRNQLKAVDENLMREQHPSMPISVDRQSRVTFGKGSKMNTSGSE